MPTLVIVRRPRTARSVTQTVRMRFLVGTRVIRSAIVLRPSTILEFHRALRTRKYRWLFSPTRRRTGPQGPSNALVDAIVDMKRRNPRWGCPRIAQQIALAFAVDIDKDVVRRVLATHSRPAPHSGGPSWLTFLGHAKDSLWSIDLFRCESAILRSHWVLVVMDHYTRRIVGFGIHAGTVDGRALCRMFNHAIRGLSRPTRLSSDHDPLYRFHQWRANLRVLQVTEGKSVPSVPLSHPFVERLIGTRRRECVDQLLFWSASDLEDKLVAFQDFYNAHRAHASLDGRTPVPIRKDVARLDRYRWDAHCRGLYQTPIAAGHLTSEDGGERVDAPAFDVYRDTAGPCVSCTPYSCHRDNVAGDSRLTGPEDRTMSDSYEFATHRPYVQAQADLL